jgi:hypothetical protein
VQPELIDIIVGLVHRLKAKVFDRSSSTQLVRLGQAVREAGNLGQAEEVANGGKRAALRGRERIGDGDERDGRSAPWSRMTVDGNSTHLAEPNLARLARQRCRADRRLGTVLRCSGVDLSRVRPQIEKLVRPVGRAGTFALDGLAVGVRRDGTAVAAASATFAAAPTAVVESS